MERRHGFIYPNRPRSNVSLSLFGIWFSFCLPAAMVSSVQIGPNRYVFLHNLGIRALPVFSCDLGDADRGFKPSEGIILAPYETSIPSSPTSTHGKKLIKKQGRTEEVEPGEFVGKCEKIEQILRD